MDQIVGRVVFETRDPAGNLLHRWEDESRDVFVNLAGRPKIRYGNGYRAIERLEDGTFRLVFRYRPARLDS